MAGRLPNTQELGPWDWRHRIGFDLDLRREIETAVNLEIANSAERQVMNELITFFSRYISVDCLIDTVLRGRVAILDKISSLPEENVLAVPGILHHLMRNKLERAEELHGDQVKPLRKLVSLACSTNTVVNPIEPMSIVFGDDLCDLISYGKRELSGARYPSRSPKAGSVKDVESVVATYQRQLERALEGRLLAQKSSRNKFFTTLVKGPGFAEYWPWFLTESSDANELILYENDDSMRKDQLYPTLNHELYPGHAYFYKCLEEHQPRFVDHGAYGFVEGWATWSEWNGINPAYCRQSRSFRFRSIQFLEADSLKYADKLFSFMREEGYNEQNALEACLHFFQYPSLGLSYTLGSIWFENHFRESDPFHFFEYLSSNALGWGDFFRLWTK